MTGKRILSLFTALMLTVTLFAGFGGVQSFAGTDPSGWSISTKTYDEGNISKVVDTMKRSDAASEEKRIDSYETDKTTGETILHSTYTMVNSGNGIEVYMDTVRDKVNTKYTGTTTGTIEGKLDVSNYIKDRGETDLVMEIKDDKVKGLLSSMWGVRSQISKESQMKSTVTLCTKMRDASSFTFKMPKTILKSVSDEKDCSLKVEGNFGYAKFTPTDVKEILAGASKDVLITLKKVTKNGNTGLRITVNNGTQVTSLGEGVELGLAYEGGFGLDPSRVTLEYTTPSGQQSESKDGISFSQKEHKIVYGAGNIGQYDVTVDPVVFSDTGKHWAKKNIDKWSNLGVIQGYAGKFNPNANIRRGDMALIVSRITGEDPVKLDREKEYMTRQDAAVLIGQSFGINPSASSNTAFSDAAGISAEARPYMYSLANKGYMKGYNGKINPTGLITRAEAVTMFGNMVETIVNYGTCTKNVKGNLLINGPDTVLKGITVDGDVYITDGVGDGEVTLDETRVTGNIYVRGGGVNSIKLKEGTQVGNVYLKRTTGALRLVSEHENTAKQVVVMDGEDQVVLTGAMANVDIKGNVSVKLKDLALKNLTVNVANAKLNADSTTHVENATLEQVADKSSFDISGEVKNIAVIGKGCLIEGSGAVDFVNIQGNDTTVKTNGTNLKVAEGVTGAIGGKDSVAAGTTATTPGKKPTISSSGKVSESVSPYAPSIKTSINDGDTYKNSRLSMHMVASDTKGNKLSATAITVTLNGTEVKKDWDDIEKTTYTLNLQEGKNTVVIEATDQGETTKKTYEITYKPKGDGTAGTLYMDIELFTLGGDFLISPISVDIKEGENGAQLLTRVLEDHGFTYKYTGKIDKGFYLAHIVGGDVNNAPMSASSIPKYLRDALDDNGYDQEDREDKNTLGEFDFTSGSGWMYSVNDDFPNVGFADYYPQDGDVMRIQFTLAIGADIGGANFYGGGFWKTENKDDIIKKYADKEVPSSVLEKLKKLNK